MVEDFDKERPEGLSFQGDEQSNLPLFQEEDTLCCMHRDAHFSGSFSAMKEYYTNPEAKGVIEEIDLERVDLLQTIQTRLKTDLAPLLITGPDAERVALSKKMYKELSDVAEKDPTSSEGMLAAAILSEEDVDDIVATCSPKIFEKPESLLLLAVSDFFCDPLFPGYGTASRMAIALLGKLRFEPAVKELFYLIGRRDFATENAALGALRAIGPAAKKFAVDRLSSFPVTADHERAALVLIDFLPDADVTKLFSKIIVDERIQSTRLRDYVKLGLES
jgi:hypothetical protein